MAVDREERFRRQVRRVASDQLFWMTAFLLAGAFLIIFRVSVRVFRRNYHETAIFGFQRPDLMFSGVFVFFLLYSGVWSKYVSD